MSYVSDLDDLHKSQWTRDLGLVPTRYSYYGAQGGGSRARLSMRGNSHKGLVFGDTRWGVQELKLRVQVSTGYYLYTNGVNSNTRFVQVSTGYYLYTNGVNSNTRFEPC